MLKKLRVSNLAIVERVEAEFASGLNVLTGETGAGKSVLMGALELVLGGRGNAEQVREGAKEARVEAEFEFERVERVEGVEKIKQSNNLKSNNLSVESAVNDILEEAGLERCEGGNLLVRRTVNAAGGGKVWINDVAATVATLRRLGKVLVDIHGPRANQSILEEHFQRDVLDRFGGVGLDSYACEYDRLGELRSQLAALEKESGTDVEMLRYAVEEFDQAALTEEDETIAERHAAAAHAEEIVNNANAITDALGGDESAAAILLQAQGRFHEMAKHLPIADEWLVQAEELTLKVQELSRAVADEVSKMDAAEESLEELDSRLTTINRLKRKHGAATVRELLEIAEQKRSQLDDLTNREERIAELRKQIHAQEAVVRGEGANISKRRLSAGTKMAKAVTSELRDLGFLKAEFSVMLENIEMSSHGCDRVVYMFGPNPGEPMRPLADIASSGEMARVMLALKGVLSEHDSTDVLVFDEIDANVGGEIGAVVGEKMLAVARHRQVIAITHLPQCAACGERHLVVTKSTLGGRTRTNISEAKGESRVREIARMLGGDKNKSEVIKRHAEELLGISS